MGAVVRVRIRLFEEQASICRKVEQLSMVCLNENALNQLFDELARWEEVRQDASADPESRLPEP